MKAFAIFAASLTTTFSSLADPPSLENFSPRLDANTPIIWEAKTNLPKDFWIYKRKLPHIFPASVISNAVVLASLEKKGFPKPSSNQFCIPEDRGPNYPGPVPCIFCITPADATLSYFNPHPDTDSSDIPNDEILIQRARDCAFLLGVDLTQVVAGKARFVFNSDKDGKELTNQICGRCVFLSRQLDGFVFYDHGNSGWNEGLSFEIGSGGKIRSYFVDWPELQRTERHESASEQQIIALIRAHKVIVIPNAGEETYMQRVKALANAKKFIITKITPYYFDGVLGKTPRNYAPPELATPVAELDAVAEFSDARTTVRMFCPILSNDVVEWLRSGP